jgi:hypothetical protein
MEGSCEWRASFSNSLHTHTRARAPLLQVALMFGRQVALTVFGQEEAVANLMAQYCWGLMPGIWPMVGSKGRRGPMVGGRERRGPMVGGRERRGRGMRGCFSSLV